MVVENFYVPGCRALLSRQGRVWYNVAAISKKKLTFDAPMPLPPGWIWYVDANCASSYVNAATGSTRRSHPCLPGPHTDCVDSSAAKYADPVAAAFATELPASMSDLIATMDICPLPGSWTLMEGNDGQPVFFHAIDRFSTRRDPRLLFVQVEPRVIPDGWVFLDDDDTGTVKFFNESSRRLSSLPPSSNIYNEDQTPQECSSADAIRNNSRKTAHRP